MVKPGVAVSLAKGGIVPINIVISFYNCLVADKARHLLVLLCALL